MNKRNNWFDAYETKARLIPAALCAVPAVLLYHYLLRQHFGGLLTDLGHLRLLGYLTIEAAATYALMQLNNRLVGKLLQGIIFRPGHMPTTQLLMPDDRTLSQETKRDIVTKFKKDFKKELPVFNKGYDENDRRQRIEEQVAHIRHATRSDLLVKNHNIEYGFVRNICGGAVAASLISVTSVVLSGLVFWNKEALIGSIVCLAVYLLLVTLSKPLINYYGRSYAKVLLEQYLCAAER